MGPRGRTLYTDITCNAVPCHLRVEGKAFARRTAGKRLRGLDFVRTLTATRRTTSLDVHLPRNLVQSSLKRYGKVAWSFVLKATDPATSATAADRAAIAVNDYRPLRTAPLTTADRVRAAVIREVDAQYGLSVHDISCRRLTTSHYRCDFSGLTREDIAEGNVGGHRGIADAYRYPSGWDVRISSYRRG